VHTTSDIDRTRIDITVSSNRHHHTQRDCPEIDRLPDPCCNMSGAQLTCRREGHAPWILRYEVDVRPDPASQVM